MVKRLTPRLRRSSGPAADAEAYPQELVVRPSSVPRVPGGLGAATHDALAAVRERVQLLVELDDDLAGSLECVALLEAVDELEREVRRLVAASLHAGDRMRRLEQLEELSTREDALWALRRGGGGKVSSASSG